MNGPRASMALWAWASAGLALGAAAPAWGQVDRRGAADAVEGRVEAVAADGVTVVFERVATPVEWWSWDQVRRVRGPMAEKAAEFAKLADAAFRVRARLERGDEAWASKLAEPYYADIGKIGGPTGALLAEAMIRIRLARGASVAAVWPWLDWTRLQHGRGVKGGPAWVGATIDRPAVIDVDRSLAPRIAPMFSRLTTPTALAAFDSSGDWGRFMKADARTRELAALYRAAAAFEAAEPDAADVVPPTVGGEDDSVTLVSDLVIARIAAGPERSAARERLVKRLSGGVFLDPLDLSGEAPTGSGGQASPAWLEAWLRAGIGRSLLRESDEASKRSGVIQMLHVPARFAPVTPELARLCLAEAIAVLRSLGDQAAAAVLEQDLAQATGEFGNWPTEDPEPATESAEPADGTTNAPAPTGARNTRPQ